MIQVTKINISFHEFQQKAKSKRFILATPVPLGKFWFSSLVSNEMGVLRQQDAVAKRQTKERMQYEKNWLAES
jgi:hypothetical protein